MGCEEGILVGCVVAKTCRIKYKTKITVHEYTEAIITLKNCINKFLDILMLLCKKSGILSHTVNK